MEIWNGRGKRLKMSRGPFLSLGETTEMCLGSIKMKSKFLLWKSISHGGKKTGKVTFPPPSYATESTQPIVEAFIGQMSARKREKQDVYMSQFELCQNWK